MTWSRRNKPAAVFLCWTLAIISTGALAFGQDTVEQDYERALNLFNSGQMSDEACQLLRKVDQEKPGYKQVKVYLNPACSAAETVEKQEDDLFNQGVQLFNEGKYQDAKQKFDDAKNKPLKTLKHRDEINGYLAKIQNAEAQVQNSQKDETAFKQAVTLFNQGKLADASKAFDSLAAGNGPHAADARDYIAKINQAQQTRSKEKQAVDLYNEGMKLLKEHNNSEARSRFEQVIGMNVPESMQAAKMLATIDQSAPGAASVGDASLELRAGLSAYFEGKFEEADRDLTSYVNAKGSQAALAYFFRGAAHSARYFLSGEKDSEEKNLALADFREAQDSTPAFRPSEKFVSPKILDLYAQARK
jgi:tetratricopeptide (TPR) repeat protein